jgi:phosphoribosylformylglycinamidine synthase
VRAKVLVTLKSGVLDPQGKAIQHALGALGFDGVREVRQGKSIEIELDETDRAKAQATVDSMCAKLLANPVIETYSVELSE